MEYYDVSLMYMRKIGCSLDSNVYLLAFSQNDDDDKD